MASPRWQAFKRGPGWIILGVVVIALMVIGLGRASDELTPGERVEVISKRLACPICDGESVFESRNNASSALRTEIRSQVDAGEASDDQIITFIEQRFGAQVLLVPRADGIDAVVWILPVVAFVCGVAGLAVAFRRWKRAADTVPTDDDRQLVADARRAESGAGSESESRSEGEAGGAERDGS